MDKPQEVANATAGQDQTESLGGMTEQQMVSDCYAVLFRARFSNTFNLLFCYLITVKENREIKNPAPLTGPRLNGYLFYDVTVT